MMESHKSLTDSLRFQLSLVRLAVNPHGPASDPADTNAAAELAKLAEKVSAGSARRVRSNS